MSTRSEKIWSLIDSSTSKESTGTVKVCEHNAVGSRSSGDTDENLPWMVCRQKVHLCIYTSWLLYGIYQIGYTIEDPFQGSLRLTILSEAIFRDVMYGSAFMDRRLTAFDSDEQQQESTPFADTYKILLSKGTFKP